MTRKADARLSAYRSSAMSADRSSPDRAAAATSAPVSREVRCPSCSTQFVLRLNRRGKKCGPRLSCRAPDRFDFGAFDRGGRDGRDGSAR